MELSVTEMEHPSLDVLVALDAERRVVEFTREQPNIT